MSINVGWKTQLDIVTHGVQRDCQGRSGRCPDVPTAL